jgi:hypothetical protein
MFSYFLIYYSFLPIFVHYKIKKLEPAKTNKKVRWKTRRSRITDALLSNTHDDQYENMLENLSMLTVQEFLSHKDRMLFMALKNGSKRCADFLLSKEARVSSNEILRKCEYQRMVEVYTLLEELSNKYEEQIKDIVVNQKPHLINRLVDPSKLDAKNERVDFLFKLISDGFFTAEEVRQQIENNYRDKPEKKSKFIALYREITLKELGI